MVISVLSLIVSAGALLVTILIYRKRRTFENENHFFNYKLEQYGTIISHVSNLLELMHNNFYDLYYEVDDERDDEVIDEITEEIDKEMWTLRVMLHKACAFIPEGIIEALDILYDKIFDNQDCIRQLEIKSSEVQTAIDNIDSLNDQLEGIINQMRNDLGIETIDSRLKMRAK